MESTRKSFIDVYRDELSRHVASMTEHLERLHSRHVTLMVDAGKVHEEGLRLLADAEVARISDAAGAAGSCCPRCGNCRGPAAAVDDEGASHD